MPDRMPNRMSEDMSDRMPEDLPVRKCINVMVGITRSKVINLFFTSKKHGNMSSNIITTMIIIVGIIIAVHTTILRLLSNYSSKHRNHQNFDMIRNKYN